MIYKGNPVVEGKSRKIQQKSVNLLKCWNEIFTKKKNIFFKTKFFGHSGKHELPKFKIWMQSDKSKPLSAHDSDRQKLTQNVHFWADIVSTLADPIMCGYQWNCLVFLTIPLMSDLFAFGARVCAVYCVDTAYRYVLSLIPVIHPSIADSMPP